MWKNYIVIAFRNVIRSKAYSAIKILGLSIGIAACFILLAYVRHELSYDTWHPRADRTFRVIQWWDYTSGERDDYATTSGNLAELLVKDHPQIEEVTRLKRVHLQYLVVEGETFAEKRGLNADKNFIDFFSFAMKSGNASSALSDINSIVLTEQLASKYYGKTDPVGRTLTIGDTLVVTVTGVLEDIPSNSHLTFDFLLPMDLYKVLHPSAREEFGFVSFYTYARLHSGASAEEVSDLILKISDRYIGSLQDKYGLYMRHYLQPVTEIYLTTGLEGELSPTSSRRIIYLLAGIAAIILLIGCSNFVNMATAQAIRRSREVEMRKAIGAHRHQLFTQFLGESLVVACLSLVLAVVLVQVGIPWLVHLAGKQLDLSFDLQLSVGLLFLTVIVGLVAGVYPAYLASSQHPLAAPSSTLGLGPARWHRRALVTVQFVATSLLITCTVAISDQVNYMKGQHLGFAKDQLLVVGYQGNQQVAERADFWVSALGKLPGVASVTRSRNIPGRAYSHRQFPVETPNGRETKDLTEGYAYYDFVDTYGLEILAGSDFNRDRSTESKQALATERMAEYSGWGYDLIGKTINNVEIVGIISDFHVESLQSPIQPVLLHFDSKGGQFFTLRLLGNASPVLSAIQSLWEEHGIARPMDVFFLDDDFNSQYKSGERLTALLATFSGLGIVIACLGLWGLTAFMAELRTKEMGIRKAVGASVASLLYLLTSDAIRSVVIGNAIAIPLAFLGVAFWLQDYSTRIDIGIPLFLPATLLTLLFSLSTVVWRSIHTARTNPVVALRYE